MISAIQHNARVIRYAIINSIADLCAIYTWRSWTFVWLIRILCQVSLFALLGRLLNSPSEVRYLLVGNACFMASNTAVQVINSTCWERLGGTLALLVASPASPFAVFAGRSALWLVDGVGVGTVSLFLLAPIFHVPLPMPRSLIAAPLMMLSAFSSYCLGLLLAAYAIRVVNARNLMASLGGLFLMVLTGVQVPVTFWPTALQWIAQGLPLTHGLEAVRELLNRAAFEEVGKSAGLEAMIGFSWLAAAGFALQRFDRRARKTGSIDFG